MHFDIILIVLFAAILHASWNALMKVQGDRLVVITLMSIFSVFIGLPFIIYFGLPKPEILPYIVASGSIHFIYKILLINAYEHGDFSQVYPIARGGAPLLLLVATIWFLNDINFTGWEVLGSLIVTFGLLLLVFNNGIKAILSNVTGILFAIGTAITIASYTYVDSIGARLNGNALHYMALSTFIDAVPILLYMLYKRNGDILQTVQHNYKNGLIVAGLSFISYSLFLWAATQAPIALIASVRETSVIFAALIGALFLKEKFGFWKTIATLTVLVGLILMRF